MRNASERAVLETKLNIHVPAQTKVGGKAQAHPDGRQMKVGQETYGEWVTHGTEDTVVRYIVVDDGDSVDQYEEGVGWVTYTHVQARGF